MTLCNKIKLFSHKIFQDMLEYWFIWVLSLTGIAMLVSVIHPQWGFTLLVSYFFLLMIWVVGYFIFLALIYFKNIWTSLK